MRRLTFNETAGRLVERNIGTFAASAGSRTWSRPVEPQSPLTWRKSRFAIGGIENSASQIAVSVLAAGSSISCVVILCRAIT